MIILNWLLILQSIKKHKRTIGILTIIATVMGIILSSPAIMKPKYKSRVVLYPANISPYSRESEIEQVMQLMEANSIRDNIITKYDLYKRYDIIPNKPASLYNINVLYNENVSVNKTGFEAIEVVVKDEDPKIAFAMANSIIDLYNKKVKQLREEKSKEVTALYLVQMRLQKHFIDSLADINQKLRVQYGVLDYYIQLEQASRGAFIGNHTLEAQKLLINLAKYGNESQSLVTQINRMRDEYAKYSVMYFESLKERNSKFTYANIIVNPTVADKKCYPIRWLIVLCMTLSAFLLSSIGAIVVELRKQQ